MRALFSSLTTRGRSFMAAGGAAMVCGLAIPEPDLVRVGALLVILPLVSALIARRSRYRLSCSRRLDPPRVPAGQPTTVTARVENVSRLRTGVLLAEDVTPYSLGSRPRFVLDEIEPGGHRELNYQIRPDTRGKFTIGPLRVRVADAFGLVEISRSFSTTQHARGHAEDLPAAAGDGASSSWLGEGDGGMRTISAIGEDDAAPRVYQDGDGLRRVHWKSTATVRRADGPPRGTPVAQQRVGLPGHPAASAHSGSGPSATFEFAVSAAASIGAHLSGEGFRARLITEAGEIAPRGTFQDTLLDMLAVISPSQRRQPAAGHVGAGQRGRPADRRGRAAVRRRRQPAGREQARERARDGPAARRLRRGRGRGSEDTAQDGGDPVGRGLAGRGGHARARRWRPPGSSCTGPPTGRCPSGVSIDPGSAEVTDVDAERPDDGDRGGRGDVRLDRLVPGVHRLAVVRRLDRRRRDRGRRRGADPAAVPAGAGLPGAGVAGLLLYLNLVFEARHSFLLVIPTPASLSQPVAPGRHRVQRREPVRAAGAEPARPAAADDGRGGHHRGADRPDRGPAAVDRAGRAAAARPVHRAGHDERAARASSPPAWCSAWAGPGTWPC